MTIWTEFLGLPVKQTFYSAKGVRTRVLECGAPDGRTLIMLHGTGGHAEAFARTYARTRSTSGSSPWT